MGQYSARCQRCILPAICISDFMLLRDIDQETCMHCLMSQLLLNVTASVGWPHQHHYVSCLLDVESFLSPPAGMSRVCSRHVQGLHYSPVYMSRVCAVLLHTCLGSALCSCRQLTQEDWETYLLPLVTQYPALSKPSMNLDTFRVAASWVASRAFGVDSYHGELPLLWVYCVGLNRRV